ncbi:MAG: LamG-like jellyroll fold domain-containing protein [Candidatus Stygibacter australis]|nr:LamG-like jellyroll fold domain-containing protein [Candidatus Stygibacter australis]
MKKIIVINIIIIYIFILSANNALYFDGIDDKIVVAENTNEFPTLFTDLDNNSFTIEFWIKVLNETPSGTRIVDIKYSSTCYFSIIYYYQKLCSNLKTSSNFIQLGSDNTLSEKWYYVKFKWNSESEELKFWLDNVLQSGSSPSISQGNDNHFYVGTKTSSGTYFKGEIDEFRIWDSVSVDWMIKDAFPDQILGTETNLYLYYDMEEFYQTSQMEDKSNSDFHADCSTFDSSSFNEMNNWLNGFQCIELDGVNDYISVINCPELNSTDYTYLLWFQADSFTSDQYLFSKGDDGYYIKMGSDQQFDFNGYSTSDVSLQSSRWYNLAVSKNQDEHKLYLDGRELELIGSSNFSSNSDPLYIGKRESALFTGNIDDIQLYDSALTSEEIADIIYTNYQVHPNLFGWFDCNHLDGNIIYDRSGNLLASLMGLDGGIITTPNEFSLKDATKFWVIDQYNGLFISILHSNYFQDRCVLENNSSTTLIVTEAWYPDLTAGIQYCISDAERVTSDLIYPDVLPDGYDNSPFTIWQNHPAAYSSGLSIQSTGISSENWLQGSCNTENGTTSEDINGGLIDYRLARVWFFDTTGTLTGVSIDFDISAICGQGITLGNVSDYRLLYRAGERDLFTALSENISAQIINDNTIRFNGSALDSPEGYYTIGAVNNAPLPVTLSSFTGNWTESRCILYWQTLSEVNNSGWNLYRGEDIEQQLQINPLIIPGAGTSTGTSHYSFEDQYDVDPGIYYYWLESISLLGATDLYGPITIEIPVDNETESPPIPAKYGIYCFPNPFNPTTRILFNVPKSGNYDLVIYNIKGQLVRELFTNKYLEQNRDNFYPWDGKNHKGNRAATGDYLIILKGEGLNYYKKITLLS